MATDSYTEAIARVIDLDDEHTPVDLTALVEELDTGFAVKEYIIERKDQFDILCAADTDKTLPDGLRCSLGFAMGLCLQVDSDASFGMWKVLDRLESLPVSKWQTVLAPESQ